MIGGGWVFGCSGVRAFRHSGVGRWAFGMLLGNSIAGSCTAETCGLAVVVDYPDRQCWSQFGCGAVQLRMKRSGCSATAADAGSRSSRGVPRHLAPHLFGHVDTAHVRGILPWFQHAAWSVSRPSIRAPRSRSPGDVSYRRPTHTRKRHHTPSVGTRVPGPAQARPRASARDGIAHCWVALSGQGRCIGVGFGRALGWQDGRPGHAHETPMQSASPHWGPG